MAAASAAPAPTELVAPAKLQPPCEAEPPLPEPLRALPSDADILAGLRGEGGPLGAASIGSPSRGSLMFGVELAASETIARAGKYPYGTAAVVAAIERAVREVNRCFPGAHKLAVGDLSRRRGGWLLPHRSHQSGLDADLGFYYRSGPAWYVRPTAETLDAPRTWRLLRALRSGGNVEVVFLDLRIQRLLHSYAASLNEPELDAIFDLNNKKNRWLRHEYGHHTHMHVRFQDEQAVALGARLARLDANGLLRASYWAKASR
jgi:penicillin-insensitive murein endopeptidase